MSPFTRKSPETGTMEHNRTVDMLRRAQAYGYAVGAYNCYNDDGVMAVIRAAEASKSPAIIQLFPWTLNFQGPHFIRWVVEYAHSASVPIAVHLDHCIEPEDVRRALELPFDSIMIDASRLDPEANIAECARIVEEANARGIAIEAELGRIEGGEDGLPLTDLESILTNPGFAREFVDRTGVQLLAPSFGNIHGSYGPLGPKAYWRLDVLKDLNENIPSIPLVLHGTTAVSDVLFRETIKRGVHKINLNRTVRDDYSRFVAANAGKLELTALKEQAVEVHAKSIERLMDVLGSSGRA
ncbi:ketose-bisphosphate aldolase [Microdochium trichocladiopsis]|uniref:Fructose-bisphosphate aldolase n=1 Tax=Microdochium trichocladiopsis TaxID=1682393 RepID=A0A9P8YAM3_9PEZI|nr:ketose-bisphosphate aldolase [Microdochium trichocladiopsis]KAH7034762.1 ketose-bisphosphate aldolase [Microdochium trichocladiopsis]